MVYGPPKEVKNSSEVSYWHLLDSPSHFQLQKVEVELIGWLFKPMRFDKKVLSLIEKVNKNYSRIIDYDLKCCMDARFWTIRRKK